MTEPIALGQPTTGAEELAAVQAVFESGWLAGQGPAGREFEAAFARLVGAPHALAVNNCTAGLHLALLAMGVGPGDEVIVADYTYPATGHAVLYCGARPRFADVRADIWTIDVDAAAALVSDRTVGIVAVDSFGQCADYDELRALTSRHGLFLVEDAACAAGATYHGTSAGNPALADVAAFSLHGRKGITSGEGGVVTTGSDDVAAFVAKRRSFGVESALSRAGSRDLPVPVFDELGWNYKLSDIGSAIARVQVDRLPGLVEARRKTADRYQELLGDSDLVRTPVALEDREHVWQSYVLTLDPAVDRDTMAVDLRDRGIGCNFGTFACNEQPVYGDTDPCPVSSALFHHHLAIPMHANLNEEQVERVARDVLAAAAAAATR